MYICSRESVLLSLIHTLHTSHTHHTPHMHHTHQNHTHQNHTPHTPDTHVPVLYQKRLFVSPASHRSQLFTMLLQLSTAKGLVDMKLYVLLTGSPTHLTRFNRPEIVPIHIPIDIATA